MESNPANMMLTKLRNLNSQNTYDYNGFQVSDLVYLTIDRNNFISLLIKTEDRIGYKLSTDLISLSLSESCSIVIDNLNIISKCHVMSCKAVSEEITKTFIALCQAFALQINQVRNSDQMLEFFSNLTQLFKITPSLDLTVERQGLWGELFVIRETGKIKQLFSCWHKEPNRLFDFAKDNLRLEVKTTAQPNRVHIFSHNQLYRDDLVQIVIASLMLKYDDAGLSLRDLIETTRVSLEGDMNLLYKLEKSVLKAGMLDEGETGPSFDETFAHDHLYWFDSRDVPRFNQFEPEGVSNTKYSVDLTNSPRLEENKIEEWLSAW